MGKGKKMDKPSMVQQLLPTMIRYKKQLDTRDWSQLSPAAQCLLLLILRKAIDSGESRFSLPLTDVKKEMAMENKEPDYWQKQADAISAHIVRSSVVRVKIPTFIGAMTLIRDVGFDPTTRKFVADLKPEFVEFLRDYSEGFTQFPTKSFISIRKKYAMNLYRLLSKNFHGHFEMDFVEFRKAMGYPDSFKNSGVCLSVEKAITELKKKGIYKKIEFEKIFADRQGRPLQSVRFTYEKTEAQKAFEAGQGTLPGFEDDAAGPSHQAPAAAPSGDPGGGPAPFAAEEPPFTADDVHGHIDPRTGLYIPSAEELAARHRPEDDKPSWRPAYSKPDIPEAPPKCPQCGGEMVKRARNDGHEFWGCANFPRCRGTRDLDGTDTSKK